MAPLGGTGDCELDYSSRTCEADMAGQFVLAEWDNMCLGCPSVFSRHTLCIYYGCYFFLSFGYMNEIMQQEYGFQKTLCTDCLPIEHGAFQRPRHPKRYLRYHVVTNLTHLNVMVKISHHHGRKRARSLLLELLSFLHRFELVKKSPM